MVLNALRFDELPHHCHLILNQARHEWGVGVSAICKDFLQRLSGRSLSPLLNGKPCCAGEFC
jgi:hypothetical protein